MSASELCIFLAFHFAMSLSILVFTWLFCRAKESLLLAMVSLTCLVAAAVLGSNMNAAESFTNVLSQIWFRDTPRPVLAASCGIASATPWMIMLWLHGSSSMTSKFKRPVTLVAGCFQLVLCLGFGLLIWDDQFDIEMTKPSVIGEEFVVSEIAKISEFPVRLAVTDLGDILVSYYDVNLVGQHSGGILKLVIDSQTGKASQRIIAASRALYRPFGLAARGKEVFVSRSGHMVRAVHGKVEDVAAGAVSVLRDLDGDGYYEYIHDVVADLPGARGPDTMHQNNGIVFNAAGELFILNGANSDRAIDEHPWGGTLLKASADFKQVEVFAEGLRNPFGAVIGPDDELFVTDNDASANAGDELNHVTQGSHYGHPFVLPHEEHKHTTGFTDPIYLGDSHSNLCGLAYTECSNLPAKYRGCLYVTDRAQNRVLRIKLEKLGDSYRPVEVTTFAVVHSPVDIAVSNDGEFFIASRDYRKIYRIQLRKG